MNPSPSNPPPEIDTAPQVGKGAFGELVAWAIQRVAMGSLEHRDAVVATARSIDHGLGLGYQIGGLEFHHDGSGRVDLLVHCESRRTTFGPEVRLPMWFGPLVARTDRDESTRSPHRLEPSAASIAASNDASVVAETFSESFEETATPRDHGRLRLTPHHWLEFDQREDHLVLAGVWQGVEAVGDSPPSRWLADLGEAFEVTGIDAASLAGSQRLAHYVDAIGVPRQVGIMSGRTGTLKVFRRVTDTADPYRSLCTFLAHEDLTAALATTGDADPANLAGALVESGPPLDVGVNLDVDLASDRFDAGVGIEIHLPDRYGPHDVSTGPEPLTPLLETLAQRFGVDEDALGGVRAVAGRLPAGASWRRSFGALDPVVHPGLRHRILLARLNHLKVVLREGRPPQVKSYVRLSVHQGTGAT